MEGCNFNSLQGKQIVLRKIPTQSGEASETYGNILKEDFYTTLKVSPSVSAPHISYLEYKQAEGKIVEDVRGEYENKYEKQALQSSGYTDRFHKIILENCAIVYINTGVPQFAYYPQETREEAEKLIGQSLWVDKRPFSKNLADTTALHHIEKAKVEDISTKTYKEDVGYNDQEVISNLQLVVTNSTGDTALLPFNEEYYFRTNPINNNWSSDTITAIKNEEIVIGMNKDQVTLSWGRPNDINRTVTEESVTEQWVYGESPDKVLLYFENGELTSFQD